MSNSEGIQIYHSFYTIISGNTVCNGNIGIRLTDSNKNNISGNIVDNNRIYGIYLKNSDDNSMSENFADNNRIYGIYLSISDNNDILGNTVNSNNIGIVLEASNNNISGNIANNNNIGIKLTNIDNIFISGNTINNNVEYGIYLDKSDDNILASNIFNNNSVAIYLYKSNSEVSSNTFNGNDVDIQKYKIPFPYEIVIAIVSTIVVIAMIITGMALFYKRKRKRGIEIKYPKEGDLNSLENTQMSNEEINLTMKPSLEEKQGISSNLIPKGEKRNPPKKKSTGSSCYCIIEICGGIIALIFLLFSML